MSSNMWICQTHRWLSIVFTVAVIANFVAMALGEPPVWVVYRAAAAALSSLVQRSVYVCPSLCGKVARIKGIAVQD